MKKQLLLLYVLLCFSVLKAQIDWDWSDKKSDGSPDIVSMAVATDGNIYLTGSYYDTIQIGDTTLFPTAYLNGFIVSFDKYGRFRWARTALSDFLAGGQTVTTDTDGNVYWAGNFAKNAVIADTLLISIGSWDIFFTKFDSLGNRIWIDQIGGPGAESINDIRINQMNGLYLSGDFGGGCCELAVNIGDTVLYAGVSGVFIAKFNLNGDFFWACAGVATLGSIGAAVSIDNFDNTYFAGAFSDSIFIGYDTLSGPTYSYTFFAAKYDNIGSPEWTTQAYGTSNSIGWKAINNSNNDLIVAGSFTDTLVLDRDTLIQTSGSVNLFLCSYSPSGSLNWVQAIKGRPSIIPSFALDSLDNIYVTSAYSGVVDLSGTILNSSGITDLFIAKYNPAGNLLWAITIGDLRTSIPMDILISKSQALYLAGHFNRQISFDSTLTTSQNEMFLAKSHYLFLNIPELNYGSSWNIYPNPFSISTTLEFENPQHDTHTLTLYDIQGRLVRTINDITTSRVVVERKNLTSGLYFFKLRVFDQVRATGKLTIK